jgi:hypothetical protein
LVFHLHLATFRSVSPLFDPDDPPTKRWSHFSVDGLIGRLL